MLQYIIHHPPSPSLSPGIYLVPSTKHDVVFSVSEFISFTVTSEASAPRLLPLTVTTVPPRVGPDLGLTELHGKIHIDYTRNVKFLATLA